MRTRTLTTTIIGLLTLTITSLTASIATAATCPNEPIRANQSTTYLPDCRAYEKISPDNKAGADIRGIAPEGLAGGGIVQASENGNKITYLSQGAFNNPQGAPVGSQYLSTLNPNTGWETQNITTPGLAGTYSPAGAGTPYRAFSANLDTGIELNGLVGNGQSVGNPPLTENAPAGYQNYYLRNDLNNNLQALLTTTPAQEPAGFRMTLEATSPDLEHIVVGSAEALTPGAIQGAGDEINLYEWTAGAFQQINVLPSGAPDPPSGTTSLGRFYGDGGGQDHMLSDDGANAAWSDGENLYLREGIGTPQVHTVQVDETEGGPDPSGEGEFTTASSDGSKVFFLDSRRLTSDATVAPAGGRDLYVFDAAAAAGHRLTDLSVDGADPRGARVLGILGSSQDGSYIYFVAGGALNGAPAGGCCNLYVRHYDAAHLAWEAPSFIASLSSNDSHSNDVGITGLAFDWIPSIGLRTTRVTPDGRHLVFMSDQSLTGYHNSVSSGSSCGVNSRGEALPPACEEVFMYSVAAGSLSCLSCNPDGSPPIGESGIPGGTEFAISRTIYTSRVISEDGSRVFFNTYDALVPEDRNGTQDVYEYEDGSPRLISAGVGAENSAFVDAGVDGGNVFFKTREPLVHSDTDQLVDLYDARVDGGRVEAETAPAVCQGESCQGPLTGTPSFLAPSSTNQTAGDNLAPPPPVKTTVKKTVKKKAVKAKKPKAKKSKKPKAKKSRAKKKVAKGRKADHGRPAQR